MTARRTGPPGVGRLTDMLARGAAGLPVGARTSLMRSPLRGIAADQIFAGMRRQFVPKRAAGIDAVIRWEVGSLEGEAELDRWEVTIRESRCSVERVASSDEARLASIPTITFRLDHETLLELAIGAASAPELYITGRMKVLGEVMFAQRLTTVFRLPGRRAAPAAADPAVGA